MRTLVFMGVAGCGKSSAAAGVATRLALALTEGDDFHPATNLQKMRAGQADATRALPESVDAVLHWINAQ